MPRLATLAFLSALPLLNGCAIPALINDKILGPVSPAGKIHAATVGAEFTVTDEGVVSALEPGQAILRPFPKKLFERLARPQSFYFMFKGLQAGVAGFSPIVHRVDGFGRPFDKAALALLDPRPKPLLQLERKRKPKPVARKRGGISGGTHYRTPRSEWWDTVAIKHERQLLRRKAKRKQTKQGARIPARPRRRPTTAGEVLKLLGAPQMWIRRKSGSLMAYRADTGASLSIYAGMPPLIEQVLPFPGIGNIRLRYTMVSKTPHKILLFFDPEDRLLAVVRNGATK